MQRKINVMGDEVKRILRNCSVEVEWCRPSFYLYEKDAVLWV